jgi:hypothetical protein
VKGGSLARISGSISLRPTRIGFLVNPTDTASISRIMRWCACLWGGRCNPIIPVGKYPPCWREEISVLRRPDREIALDYMYFFEPDVLVEAQPGLAESIGYGALAEGDLDRQLLSLDELFSSNGEYPPRLQFGLSVRDAYRDIFRTERQFVLRDAPLALIFNETKLSPLVETVFGVFPIDDNAQSFRDDFVYVFRPETIDPAAEHWFKYFRDRAITPFVPTTHKIEIHPRQHGSLSFFILDHTEPSDLIDYWNKRLFDAPVYPVPICWLEEIAPTMVEMITRNHRPIPNNPFGTKFMSVVYFGRSLKQDTVSAVTREHLSACPDGAFRPGGVWHPSVPADPHAPVCERHSVKVHSISFDAEVVEGNSIQFNTLAPDFAEEYGRGHHRWVNVVNLRSFGDDTWALTYPSNLQDRTTPRLFLSFLKRPIISREGWVIGQEYKGTRERVKLADGPTAIAEWLDRKGIKAEPSGAGRVAKQMLQSLGGLWDTHVIAHPKVIELLDKMAGQQIEVGAADETRRRRFEGPTIIVRRWKDLIKEVGANRMSPLTLDDFTRRGILKLGLSVECPNCNHNNWYGLDTLKYRVTCERCLKDFEFPQGNIPGQWKYRIVGPFSVPRLAEGAYSVVLTLNVFNMKILSGDADLTYSTGLDLHHKNFKREIDLAFWHSERPVMGQRPEPRFVFGEAKSFADEAVTDRDIETLKLVAKVVPGAIVVVSVMKMAFSEEEKKRLAVLTKWGWELVNGRVRAQVLLLTGVELFARRSVRAAWKEAGAPYPKEASDWIFRDLDNFARATQKIHLGLDYYEALDARVIAETRSGEGESLTR